MKGKQYLMIKNKSHFCVDACFYGKNLTISSYSLYSPPVCILNNSKYMKLRNYKASVVIWW